jgi:hypothetical protein
VVAVFTYCNENSYLNWGGINENEDIGIQIDGEYAKLVCDYR